MVEVREMKASGKKKWKGTRGRWNRGKWSVIKSRETLRCFIMSKGRELRVEGIDDVC